MSTRPYLRDLVPNQLGKIILQNVASQPRNEVTPRTQRARGDFLSLKAPKPLEYENLLSPNQVWASDLTNIHTAVGRLYLAVVIDLFSHEVVGQAMAPAKSTSLVAPALKMAIKQRNPAPGLIVHSYCGRQSASDEYQNLLAHHKLVCSMGNHGDCSDKFVTERLFLKLNLRMERVWQRGYVDQAEALRDIAQYIVGLNDEGRLRSMLGDR